MLVLKCTKCNAKLIKYHKIGKGRVLRCWFKRIIEDRTIHDGSLIKCKCGNVLGNSDELKIKMKQGSFTVFGTYN